MKLLLTAFLALVSATSLAAGVRPTSGGNRPGEFKGYFHVQDTLKMRLVAAGNTSFQLSAYFGEAYPQPGGLAYLLGAFTASGPGTEFKNGAPNSLNMLLWYMAASGFAQDLASVCDTNSPTLPRFRTNLDQNAFERLRAACVLPEDEEERRAVLQRLWISVVGFDAPRQEFDVWATHFGEDPSFATFAPKDRLAAMLMAALLNPYFLLEV